MNKHSISIKKTAFCPGSGYDLSEFTVMHCGFTGTQICQQSLDKMIVNNMCRQL